MLQILKKLMPAGRFGPATVKSTERLTPHMIRISLFSELIHKFPEDCAGGHFKIVAPEKGQSAQAFADFVTGGNFKSAMRTYTIRRASPERGVIDVDIVTHGDVGRVGAWAQRAEVGDVIIISQCGSPKLITDGADRIIAAADLTGFPALAAGLETLATAPKVDAFVEIPSEDDRQTFSAPDGIDINWILKPDPFSPSKALFDKIKALPVPDANTSVFVAAEFSAVGVLRAYFQRELNVSKDKRYISSYWKAGMNEPEHKIAKASIKA